MISQTPSTDQRPCTLIVTGASSGIGWELARLLAERDHSVIAIGRDERRLAELARLSQRIAPTPFDLARTGAIEAFTAELLTHHPHIDGLINNAAIQHQQRIDDAHYTSEHVGHEIGINLTAPILLTRALLPHLQARSHAVIVNVNSALGFVPKRTAAVYSATKAGLRLFSAGLRVQVKGSNVRVIDAIMPLVDTPMTAGRGTGKMSAATAAAAIADRLWTGPDQLYVGKTRALRAILRAAPSLAERLIQRN
jgi:short-subunit dehydrogenase involved in D-alanine esterification of teichoic acids